MRETLTLIFGVGLIIDFILMVFLDVLKVFTKIPHQKLNDVGAFLSLTFIFLIIFFTLTVVG